MKIQLLLLISILSFTSCLDLASGSKNEILQEIMSPLKTKKAIYFLKYTGSTSDNSLQVSLNKSDYTLLSTEAGNIFTSDSDHGKVVLDSSAIQIMWRNDTTLLIRHNKNLRVFINEKLHRNTTIEYEQFESIKNKQ